MALKPLGSSYTEILVDGVTEYGPAEQTGDSAYDVLTSTSINDTTPTSGTASNTGDPDVTVDIPLSGSFPSATIQATYTNTDNFDQVYDSTVQVRVKDGNGNAAAIAEKTMTKTLSPDQTETETFNLSHITGDFEVHFINGNQSYKAKLDVDWTFYQDQNAALQVDGVNTSAI